MKHYEDFFNEAQQYSKILKNYEENGEIFSDNNFHPDFSIIETKTKIESFTWRRIDEFYPAPLFKREFIRPDDIDEGSLSDSGLVSALAWAASRPERVIQLFSVQSHKGQPDSADLNCGAVVVLLHSFGRATPILIDTRVPFLKGTRRPAFSRPRRFGCSAWFCLVEKAVAKLLGGYSAVSGIKFSQACYILFGFLPDRDSLLMKPDFTCMVKWLERGEVIGATAESDTEKEGKVTEMGLVEGCVYLISKARSVSGRNFFVVRSPRASIEWLGEWSSTSVELTRDFRSNLGLCGGLSGTFCMIDSDFFSHFKKIDVSQQKECLKHSVRIFTRIKTDDYDGCEVNSQTANLESHQTFAFKLKSETQISDEVRVDVVVEKWSPPNISDESDSGIDVVVAFSGGKKLTHESLTQYSHQEFTSKEKIFSFSFKVTENSPCVIVFNRNTKRSYSEECYATLSCDYEFDIYDVDNEEEEDIFTNEINSITQMTVADDITQKDSLNNESLFASGFSDHDFFNYSSEDDIFCMIERELASFSHINEQPINSSNDDFNERIEKLIELSKNTHLRVEDKIPPFFSSVRSIVSDACNIQNENEKQSNFIKKVCSILKIDQNEKKYEDILNILQKRLENNESDFANENAVKKEEKSQNVADKYDNPLSLSAEEACQTQSSNEKDQVLFNSEVSQKSFQKESNSLTDNDFQEESNKSNDNQIQFNPEFEISIEEEDEIEIRFQPIKENEEKLNQDESDEKVQYLIDLEAEEEDIQFKQNDELSVDSQIKNEILSNEDENSSNSKQEIIPLITNESISEKQENKSEEAKTTLNINENPTQTQTEEKQNEVKSNDTDKKEESSPNEKETKKQTTTKAKRKLNSIKDENEFIKQPIKIKKKNSPETDTNLPSTQPKRTTNSLTRKRSNSQIVSLSAKNKEAIQIDGLSDSQKVNAPQLQTSLYPSVVDDINDSEGKGGKIWKIKPSDDPEKPFVISRENSNQKQKRSRRSASQKNTAEKSDNNQKKIEKVSLSEPLKKIKHKHTVDVKITINDPDNEAEISVKKNFNQNRPKRSRSKAVSKNQKKETVTEKDKSKDESIDTVEENEPKSSTDVKKRKENRSATKNDSEKVHHSNKNIEKKNENSNKTKNDNSKDKKNENSNEKKKENSNKTKNENSKETKKEKPSKKSSEKEKVNRRASSVKCHEKRSHDKEKAAQSNCQKSVEISVAFDRSKDRVSSECSSTVSTSDTSSFFFPFSATYHNLLRKRQRDYDDDFEFNFDEFDFDIKDRYWDTKLGYEREYFNLKTGGRYINPSHVVNSCRRRNPSVNYNRRPIQENYVNFLGLQSNQINCSYLPKRIRRY